LHARLYADSWFAGLKTYPVATLAIRFAILTKKKRRDFHRATWFNPKPKLYSGGRGWGFKFFGERLDLL
jgi:hypothetical protein